MEDGPHGLLGLNAMPPVAEEFKKEAESVTTHHRSMVGRSVVVTTMKFAAVIQMHVLVSPLAREAFQYIQYHLQWIFLTTC